MSHVSFKLREHWIPCEVAAMDHCDVSSDAETCDTFKEPMNCPKYHRTMILEGEEPYEPWLFNKFVSDDWLNFWTLLEQGWAELFKFNVYYGSDWSCDCGSSTCDECNPGWDLMDETDFEEPDYDF